MRTRFNTWKKVIVGNGLKSFEDFKKVFDSKKITIDDLEEVQEMIQSPSFEVFKSPTELELVIVEFWKNDDLGVNTEEICPSEIKISVQDLMLRAYNVGLEECPPETALQLRLQHFHDFPHPGGVNVVMNPISEKIFQVYTREIRPDYSGWSSDERPMLTIQEERSRTTYVNSFGVVDTKRPCYYLNQYVFMKPLKE